MAIVPLRFRSERFFGAKLLRTGATARVAVLSGGDCTRESPHFYRASKNGYPGHSLAYTLALYSLVSAVVTCTKNGSPDREAHRSFTKGKKIKHEFKRIEYYNKGIYHPILKYINKIYNILIDF